MHMVHLWHFILIKIPKQCKELRSIWFHWYPSALFLTVFVYLTLTFVRNLQDIIIVVALKIQYYIISTHTCIFQLHFPVYWFIHSYNFCQKLLFFNPNFCEYFCIIGLPESNCLIFSLSQRVFSDQFWRIFPQRIWFQVGSPSYHLCKVVMKLSSGFHIACSKVGHQFYHCCLLGKMSYFFPPYFLDLSLVSGNLTNSAFVKVFNMKMF